jgi:hypothetical protein
MIGEWRHLQAILDQTRHDEVDAGIVVRAEVPGIWIS